jgi:hypothetical protein
MSRRSASSTRVRCFRPALEILEDRIVPAGLDDLLNNPTVQQFLQPAKQAIINQITNTVASAAANTTAGEFWILQKNYAASAFNQAPNLNNFNRLEYDAVQLINSAFMADIRVEELRGYLSEGENLGLVSGLTASALEFTMSGLQAEANRLMQAANTAFGDFIAASVALAGSGHTNLTTIPTAPSSTPVPTTGGIAYDYYNAPASASQSGPNITESVRVSVSPDSDAPVTVKITYVANDRTGPYYANQSIDPGTAQTVSLTVMPCSAGVVGTWTVQIFGYDTHTNTTTFTQ